MTNAEGEAILNEAILSHGWDPAIGNHLRLERVIVKEFGELHICLVMLNLKLKITSIIFIYFAHKLL